MRTFITTFRKFGVMVDDVIRQRIWKRESFATVIAGKALVMILLHVGLIHAKCCVDHVADVALHDGSVLEPLINIFLRF